MENEEDGGPLGRPHHGDSYEIPPIVSPDMLDKDARRRLERQLRQLAEQEEISRATLLVGMALLEVSRVTGAAFPKLVTIARRAFCKVRTVQRAIRRLRDLGVLTWVRRITRLPDGRGVQTSNSYVLKAPPEPVRHITRLPDGRGVQTSNSYVLKAPPEPTAPLQEQSRSDKPLRFLRALGTKLESACMDMMSTGKERAEAERALKAARERPQLRLHLLAGRRRLA